MDKHAGYTPAWNSHIATLAHVCRATGLEWDTADIAGVTGAAFRVALCVGVTPPSLYHTWSFPQYFTLWLGALGIDAAVTWHPGAAPGAKQWLERARGYAARSLDAGFPVIYWDNLAFSVITGRGDDGFLSAGIARAMVHPDLANPHTQAPYLPRLADAPSAGQGDSGEAHAAPFPLQISLDELTCDVSDDLFFACPLGAFDVDRELAVHDGIVRLARELSGEVEYPRRYSPPGFSCNALYGLSAIARQIEELRQGFAHHFGLVQFIQSQAEGRRWGVDFLKRSTQALPQEYAPRVAQAAEFMGRAARRWLELARRHATPLDAKAQLGREDLAACAEELYQVHKTEETARRLLVSVAEEIAH